MNKNLKKVLLLGLLLVILTGCTSYVGSDGKTLAEKIIKTSTTFSSMFENESWFTAIFVYPIAQLINIISPYIGVVFAVVVVTLLVNALTLPLTIKSSADTQKMQMLQPEMNKIQKKYEGKDDDRSKMAQAQELNALYAKYNIKPLSTIAGLFVTFPIIIAMYQAVNRAEAVCNGTFLGADLQISPWSSFKIGGNQAIICVVIYIIMGITQFVTVNISKWLANSKNKKDHKIRSYTEQAPQGQTQMMTYSMLLMVLFMGATFPTAMSVYWLVSNGVNVLKTIFIQKFVVEKGKK